MRQQSDKYLEVVARTLTKSTNQQVRYFVSVLLRQDVSIRSPVWGSAGESARRGIKAVLLNLLDNEQNPRIRRYLCEIVGRLASREVPARRWDTVLQALRKWCASTHAAHLESALHISSVLSEYDSSSIMQLLDSVHEVILKGFAGNSPQLQLAAVKACCDFIISLDAQKHQSEFIKLIPGMFQTLEKLVRAVADEECVQCIDKIAALLSYRAQMFRPLTHEMIKLMANTACFEQLEPGTRRTALSFIVELAKKDRVSIKESKEMQTKVLPLAFNLLTHINETKEEWSQGSEEKNPDEEDFNMGWDTLDYLSSYLGGKITIKTIWPLIDAALRKKEWTTRHAALSALCAIMDGCSKMIEPKLEDLLAMVVPIVANEGEHVRVRWAAVNVIGYICVWFSEKAADEFGPIVAKTLKTGMDSRAHHRLAAHSALCLVDYCKHSDTNKMVELAPHFLDSLHKLLGINVPLVQANALSAVSAIASSIEETFDKYYTVFMPGVIKLLQDSKGQDKLKLRAKAIECVGVIAAAVGPEKFRPQFQSVMEFLLRIQKCAASDDPQTSAVLETCARICQSMGTEFAPYVKIVIPPLLEAAAATDGAYMQDGDDDDVELREGFETIDFSVRGIGNKRLVLNTAMLQEKATACHMLYQYAAELKEGFAPYVKATAEIMIPLMAYRYHEGVRVAAVDCIPPLLTSLKASNGSVRELFDYSLARYLQALKLEGDISNMVGILHSFSDAIDVLDRPMTSKQIKETHAVLMFLLRESNERRQSRLAELKTADDELKETVEEENEQEDEMIGYIGSVIKSIAVLSKGDYVDPFSNTLFPLIWGYLHPKGSSGMHTAALIAFCEVIENGGSAAKRIAEKFMEPACIYATDEDPTVRQSAVYGIGVAAQSLDSGFAKYSDGALKCLVKVITSKDARGEEYGESTDNAISSVGKIIKIFAKYNAKALPEVMPMWLSWLPAKTDEEEAPVVHSMLLDFLEDFKSPIYGKNNSNLVKILSVLGEVSKTELVDERTQGRIKALLGRISSGLNNQQVNELRSSLGPQIWGKLQAM